MSRNNINQVTLTGRLTRTPEVRCTPSGLYVCDFIIAINRYDSNGNQHTVYPRCTAWHKTAEFIGHPENGLQTGDLVLVTGRLADDNFETIKGDEQSKTKGRIKVDQCSIELLLRAQKKTDEKLSE